MLSNDLSTGTIVFACFSGLFLLVSAFLCGRAVKYSQAAWRYVMEQNENSRSLAEIATISAQLTELDDAYHALLDSHKKLRSRVGMREVREKRKNGEADAVTSDGLPDPQTDPEGWKREMRLRLRSQTMK